MWKTASRVLLEGLAPRVDKRLPNSTLPFDRASMMLPHDDSRLWSWTHYGVFLPDLPAPWRYLNTMTFIGPTGVRCFDNGVVASADCRRNATVLSSTAYADQHHYAAYDIDNDCEFSTDGRRLRWGTNLTIENDFPTFTVTGRYESFGVHLQLDVQPQASWFVDSPIYQHVSLLAPYSGSIEDANGTTKISGTGTVEYAKCVSPQSFTSRVLPPSAKLPVDFFTYQIINIAEDVQLLLTDVRALGVTACKLAYIRTAGKRAEVYSDVRFDVLEWAESQVDRAGRAMRMPARMRWTIADVAELVATVDSPPRYGHGNGYVGAYTYTGRWKDESITGSGYFEWVDTEDW
ncbi:hypothetical protein FZI91_08795 [Mycobacterium sp. CBMA271]|uniref:DUF6670 family protein n=1 Tax=unclassified Mycobacteroides TaxID=2618759 RepID=UPI0012DD52A7|nr:MULTISPECIES: DUF6670 family protein [unclassified Mycobacteroides]MUM15533.1 hypothetical protein [Mycobacteroides sp. CBMA 326]MUM17328.1 hypothetical protein [Mycobacteroides sp. CBMA 326]MUM21800.1 hypothetical protein [Mycobacteroides sp. CBMA 271]